MRKKIYLMLVAPLMAALYVNAQVPGANVDIKHYRFAITLNDANNVIKGQATITAKFFKPATILTLDLHKKNKDGKGMLVVAVKENNLPVKFKQDSDKLILSVKAAKGTIHKYNVTYAGVPADGLIISTNQYKHRTFFGDN